ncbi:MAG: glutamate racemase [Spirochaetes bacterium]|nr:glutamate racemase [Spirochaetota bacterium]
MDGTDSTVSLKSSSVSMNGTDPIAFFDSGVGGLPYLRWAKEHLPNENYVYLLDRANFPYGTKTKEEVLGIVLDGISRLIVKVHPKIIVLACNTATVVALQKLRTLYPAIPFVGVVPAVKPAAERTHGKRIGVMATNRTLQDVYLDNLIKQFAPHCEVVRVAGPGIVEFVEQKLFQSTPEERYSILNEAIKVLKERKVDEVVLGCTHFLYLEEELRLGLGEEIELIDSRDGVGRQLIKVLTTKSSPNPEGKKGDLLFLTGTSPVEERYYTFARMFGLEVAGVL